VLAELRQPRGRGRLKGVDIVNHILNTYSYAWYHEPVVLGIRDGVEVSLTQDMVGSRYDMEQDRERRHSLWIAQGAILRGPVGIGWEKPHVIIPPRFNIIVQREGCLPAVDPAMKAKMNELAEKIATSFRTSI